MMDMKKIVLVDTDEDYLSVLEYKLIEEWGESTEIEIITQLSYFHEYFNQPREIFLLVINEILFSYEEKVKKQNINHIFLLSENESDWAEDGGGINLQRIYKYSSIRDIFMQIHKKVGISLNQQNITKTEVSLVGTVCGGTGKTMCALGLCRELADSGKRVLYINTEQLQDFGMYIEDIQWMGTGYGYTMAMNDSRVILDLQQAVGWQDFDYLKPFDKFGFACQISIESYLFLTERVRDGNLYDHIVVEIPRDLESAAVQFLDMADRIFMICSQELRCARNLDRFIRSLTIPEEKYIFICNRFNEDHKNYLLESPVIQQCSVSCYIPQFQEPMTLKSLNESGALRTSAILL